MTNEEAVKMIQENHVNGGKSERLASMYAMDDIIHDDIHAWLEKPVHEHIGQFVSIGAEVLKEYLGENIADPVKQRTFAEGAIGIAESMYEYAKIYHELSQKSTSER